VGLTAPEPYSKRPLVDIATDGQEEDRPATGRGQVLLRPSAVPSAGQADQLLHMYRLSDPALAELALEPLLQELLDRTKAILAVDTVAILLIDDLGRELVARAARGVEEEVERGVRIPLGGGFAGRIATERTPIFIADVDHADIMNPILREVGIRSLLGVPLIVEGSAIGVLHVGTLTPREFTEEDAALLQLAASRVAPAIERVRLFEALEREHRGAVALQRSLLPERLPDIPGVDAAARYLPARDEVGGDWYDVIELPRGLVGVAIGDVAGHGVRAAALMGQLRTGLRAYALEGHSPAETLKRLDRLLQAAQSRAMATAAYAVLAPETGEVVLANAGHPPGVVISASGEARLLDVASAPPLGALRYPTYNEHRTTLAPGDALLLYTDGLVERRDESLVDRIEELRATAAVVATADAMCTHITEALVPELGTADDVALVVVRTEPLQPTLQLRMPAEPSVLVYVRRALRRWLVGHGASAEDVSALVLAAGEACANAIEHAYAPRRAAYELHAAYAAGTVTLVVRDRGRWRPPRGENRGRGLKLVEAMVDELEVHADDRGTEVVMRRRIGS
jgi:GAF domain-containing protein/anti-sigma regulatory factor (Ser/Thr protein kinase)